MTLHPALAAELVERARLPRLEVVGAAAVRPRIEAFAAAMKVARPDLAHVWDEAVPSGSGTVTVRCYAQDRRLPAPTVIYIHGGGFVHSSLETHDWICRHIATRTEASVVSVGYRLAPESPFPAAHDDGVAAIRWVLEQTTGARDAPAYALMGDSAGGNLCASAALMMRDLGLPQARGQVLFYPSLGGHLLDLPSYAENGQFGFDRATYDWFWTQYAPAASAAAPDPRIFPLLTDDFRGLPPTLAIAAPFDLMRDDCTAYVDRLRAAGGQGEVRLAEGMNHGFLFKADLVAQSLLSLTEACAWVRRALTGDTEAAETAQLPAETVRPGP